jgi:hypothetical protein
VLFGLAVLVELLTRDLGPLLILIGVAVLGPMYRSRSDRLSLTIGPDGVEFNRASVPWENIVRIENRRTSILLFERRDVFVLSAPIEYSKWVTFGKQRYVPLGLFDRDWRRGAIGHDIRRWAHRLLDV